MAPSEIVICTHTSGLCSGVSFAVCVENYQFLLIVDSVLNYVISVQNNYFLCKSHILPLRNVPVLSLKHFQWFSDG